MNAKKISDDKIAADKWIFDQGVIAKKTEQDAQIAADKLIEDAKNGTAREISAAEIAANKLIEDAKIDAAREAEIARLAQEKELAGLSRDAARAQAIAEVDAMEAAGDKALVGNILTTGATLGLAYMLSPDKTPQKETPTFKDFVKQPWEPTTEAPAPPPTTPATLEPPAYVYEGPTVPAPPPTTPATLEPPPPPELPTEPRTYLQMKVDYDNESLAQNRSWDDYRNGWAAQKSAWDAEVAAYQDQVAAYNNYDWTGYKEYYDYQNAGYGDVGPGTTFEPPAFYQAEDYGTGAPSFYQSEDYWGGGGW